MGLKALLGITAALASVPVMAQGISFQSGISTHEYGSGVQVQQNYGIINSSTINSQTAFDVPEITTAINSFGFSELSDTSLSPPNIVGVSTGIEDGRPVNCTNSYGLHTSCY